MKLTLLDNEFQMRHSAFRLVMGFSIIVVAPAVSGCGSGESAPEPQPKPESYLGLEVPAAGKGFQIRAQGTTIPPGDDLEFCEVAEIPGDPSQTYYVTSIELANGNQSHHLIVSAPIPGGFADAALQALNVGDRVECLRAEAQFGADMQRVHIIQQPYGKLEFPTGVGREYHGGQRIVFDYHYLNTTTEDVQSKSAMNMHTTDAANITQIGQNFSFFNYTVDVPAGQSGTFTGECHFKEDVKVSQITRHTHRWGTDYSVWFSGGDRDGEHIWTSDDWQHDVDFDFSEPLLMKAGEGFRFQCSYQNNETRSIRFGSSANDEMCILFGVAWPASNARTMSSQNCSIAWVDDEGIGHPASENGGFPPASPSDAAVCLGGGYPVTPCLECQCNACAPSLINCAFDPGSGCVGDKCIAACREAIDQHSSGVGLIEQAAACVNSRCPDCS
jgi:hypothetical protein